MGYGFNDFTIGDTPGASDFDGIMRQTTMVFDDVADRDAQLTAPEEGMRAFTADAFTYWCYADGAWAIESEPPQAWSPTLEQAGNVAATVNFGWFQRSRHRYWAECKLTATATGSSGNIIAVTTPLTQVECHGKFDFWDDSIGWYRSGGVLPYSTTLLAFTIDQGTDYYGIASGDGLTANDALWLSVQGTF